MNFPEAILFVALGAVVGFAGGLFAIGGALIAIPLLTAGFSFTQHDSQGTAMVMAVASACVTLAIYVRKGLLRVRDSLLMIACSTDSTRPNLLVAARAATWKIHVNYRVGLFIRVPGRISSIDWPVNSRTSTDESRTNASIRIARSPAAVIPEELLRIMASHDHRRESSSRARRRVNCAWNRQFVRGPGWMGPPCS